MERSVMNLALGGALTGLLAVVTADRAIRMTPNDRNGLRSSESNRSLNNLNIPAKSS